MSAHGLSFVNLLERRRRGNKLSVKLKKQSGEEIEHAVQSKHFNKWRRVLLSLVYTQAGQD